MEFEETIEVVWFTKGIVNSDGWHLCSQCTLWGRAGCKPTGEIVGKSSSAPSLCGLGKSPHLSGPQLLHAEYEDNF